MIMTLEIARFRVMLAAALFAVTAPALAQAPSAAQTSAIRSACRADYQAHCASVTPGGTEALQCLQKNMSSLSAACQSAVRAIDPAGPKAETAPAAPKTETPAAAPAATAAPTAAPSSKPQSATSGPAKAATSKAASGKPPSSTQTAAIKSACRTDYPQVCAGVAPGGAPALQCLEQNKARLSPACAKAVSAVAGVGGAATAAPAASTPAPTPAAAPTVIVLRPLRPREELFIVGSACGGDIRTLCAGVAPGGGRIAQCLVANAAALSPACRDVLAPFAAQ